MKIARALLSVLSLSLLASACATGGVSRTASDPYGNLMSSAAPAPSATVPASTLATAAPVVVVTDGEGSWSSIWTAQPVVVARGESGR